eukprot:jgi/Hompol1/4480/HPOL_003675-RA
MLFRTEPDIHPAILREQTTASRTRNAGESAVYRNKLTPHGTRLHTSVHSETGEGPTTPYAAFWGAVERFGDRDFVAHRTGDGPFQFTSYNEMARRVDRAGPGFVHAAKLTHLHPVGADPVASNFVGIFLKNCVEWLVTDYACISYGLVTVPIHETFDADSLAYILNHTELSVLLTGSSNLTKIFAVLPRTPHLKVIVVADLTFVPEETLEKAKALGVRLITFSELESLGAQHPIDRRPGNAKDVFTAGGGGILNPLPKNLKITDSDAHLSYLPMSHMLERIIIQNFAVMIGFFRGDINLLFDDILVFKPTVFPTVPRLLSRLYDRIHSTVEKSGFIAKFVFNLAFDSKKRLLERGVVSRSTIWDRLVFGKIQDRLGGRVRFVVTGAAPISPEIITFVRIVFGINVIEGYGQTETSATGISTMAGDYLHPYGAHVGVPFTSSEYKLVDVPSMDYFSTDPNPRGEICFRGPTVMRGYYKDPVKTKETIDEDGWLHTGDVGEVLPNGTLKIIDRVKNIFKLSQGEYVAPEKIEQKISSKLLAQIYVHGDSLQACLVMIGFPDHERLQHWAKQNGLGELSIAELCKHEKVKKAVLDEIIATGKAAKLVGYEIPKAVYLSPELIFKASGTIESIFTGGAAALTPDGKTLVTTYGDDVVMTDLATGAQTLRIKGVENSLLPSFLFLSVQTESDSVTCFALKPDGSHIVVAYQSLLIKIYDATTGSLEKSFKAHDAPVLAMAFDATSTLVATGSADSTVKVWDVDHGFCTHNFKGHGGIVSVVRFHPDPDRLLLVSGSDDCKICLWDLTNRSCIATLVSHVSVIRGLDFSPDGRFLFSGARDKVFIQWDIDDLKLIQTTPIFESIEALAIVDIAPNSDDNNRKLPSVALCTGGEKGVLKLWNIETGQLIHEQTAEHNAKHQISGLIWSKDEQTLIAITSDQNLLFYSIGGISAGGHHQELFQRKKQIAGYNEEVLDLCLVGGHDTHLAVITNTEQIRVYDIETRNCDIVYGHSDTVLSVASSADGKYMITGSKDHSATIWKLDMSQSRLEDRYKIVANCTGHTEPVTAVTFSRHAAKLFAVTGSQDRTIKVWDLDAVDKASNKIKARYTFQAHEKDIQSVAVSPNNKMIASGALDKTAKLWSSLDGSLLGTFKGHKRGIWNVKFSPIDQVLATASTDKTIKIWNIQDFSCTRTFEGHLNTVLNISFLTAGMQLISSGSDGLIKLWNIKDNECVGTFDNHEDRIWGLAVDQAEQRVFSGSSDSSITIWSDVTVEEKEIQEREQSEKIIKEQDLSLYLVRHDYRNAVMLAMQLDQPFRILGILSDLQRRSPDSESITGSLKLDNYFADLEAKD